MTTEPGIRVAIDTNVLIYAEGFDDQSKQRAAQRAIRAFAGNTIVPVQVLGEFFRVMTRKVRVPPSDAAELCLELSLTHSPLGTSPAAFEAACELAKMHSIPIWDAVIIAVAAEAGCSMLLSEDGHEGFSWAGVLVVNPFATPHHPRLAKHLS